MMAVLKSASEICWKIFVNILHFLPLRTKMAVARPILKLEKFFYPGPILCVRQLQYLNFEYTWSLLGHVVLPKNKSEW